VIGINTAISSRTGGYQGVGFAVPVNLAKWVAKQLIDDGKVRRAYLGVVIQPVTHELSEHLGVKTRQGVVVTEVMEGTPAADAGLKAGDVIVEFAGERVHQPLELQGVVEQARIGSRQKMVVMRDGEQRELTVTVREQPGDFGRTARSSVPGPSQQEPESSELEGLGMTVEPLTDAVAEHLGLEGHQGLVITEVTPGGPAAEAGLGDGLLITQADRQPVRTVELFERIVQKASAEKGVLLQVRSKRGARFVVVKPAE